MSRKEEKDYDSDHQRPYAVHIGGENTFYDVVRVGLDGRSGKLTDLIAAGVIIPGETGCAALVKAVEIVQTLHAVKCVLM